MKVLGANGCRNCGATNDECDYAIDLLCPYCEGPLCVLMGEDDLSELAGKQTCPDCDNVFWVKRVDEEWEWETEEVH
jgi:uncharacterized protein YbaR (Trm112 family)